MWTNHPDVSEADNAMLNGLCGYWRVDNDYYRIERCPEGGIWAENCRNGEEVSAPWVTLRGLPVDHPLCGRM